jgi:uncharacterized membrane protein
MDLFTEAPNLVRRYRGGKAFRYHVEERKALVLPAVLVFMAFSVATTAGSIVFIGGTHPLRTLFAIVIAPFILIGSVTVLLFVFFSWLESRAMASVTGSPAAGVSVAALRATLARLPIPWLYAGIFIALPLLFVAAISGKIAALLLFAALLTPILYALLDRAR